MKKTTILVAALLMMAITAQAQNIQKVFEKYSTNERFSYTSIGSGPMGVEFGLDFLSMMDIKTKDAPKLKGLRVLTLEAAPDDKLMKSVIDDVNEAVKKDKKAETLVESRNKGTETYIYSTSEGLLLVNKKSKELSIVCVFGEFSKN
ncbi:MAG: DUF4252 domain-containing protein [Prevotellaceae bacterium]|jgi:hypothetical protein|nr:DUF4252 domain-containing protein [Prevotellaceae bacterium]